MQEQYRCRLRIIKAASSISFQRFLELTAALLIIFAQQ